MDQQGVAPEAASDGLQWRVDELTEVLRRERAERAAGHAAQRRLAFLAAAGAVLGSSLDYTTTLANMARLAVPQLADCCMVDLVTADGTFGQTAVAHHDPAMEERVRALRQRHPPAHRGSHALARVVHSGMPFLVRDVTDDWLRSYTRNADHFALMKEMGLRSYMCVPLATPGRILGALTFLSSQPERCYVQDDLVLQRRIRRPRVTRDVHAADGGVA